MGQTGFQFLSNHTPFFQNFILAQNGIDAALGGADLELGAYLPGLADWAGMINVGGYAFGNARYTQNYGPDIGDALVPWFGGVYTRLDMTFAQNWDFSIQYNNDSFFDSTGFVRLTYRMGGSRRRNVPDQMEQPMFRNEHIVRAHETPLVALNPENNNQPWQVVHVDNSAFPNGNGTAESPYQLLSEAQADPLALEDWTITYLWAGQSLASGTTAINPYIESFAFQGQNQFLIGSGGPLTIASQPVQNSTLLTIPALTTTRPVLSNTNSVDRNGASIVIAGGNGGATVANVQTLGSIIGLDASGDLSGTTQPVGTTANPFGSPRSSSGGSSVRNVAIAGDGTSSLQRGVRISDAAGGGAPAGDIEFSETVISNTTSVAFQVGTASGTPPTPDAGSGGAANIDFYGTIANDTATNGNFSSLLVALLATTGGEINLAATNTSPTSATPNRLIDIGGQGLLIRENSSNTTINLGNVSLADTTPTAIAVIDDDSTSFIATTSNSEFPYGISKSAGNATINIRGGAPQFTFFGTINNASSTVPNGPIIGITDVDGANISISGPGLSPLLSSAGGVEIIDTTGLPNGGPVEDSTIAITGLDLRGNRATAIDVLGADDSVLTFTDTRVTNATSRAVLLDSLQGSTSVAFNNLEINLNNGGSNGIEYIDSTNNGGVRFTNTGIAGTTSNGILLSNNTAAANETTFENLTMTLTSGTSRGFAATDAGVVFTAGANTIANASPTLAAIFVEGNTTLSNSAATQGLDFVSVSSGNTNGTGQIGGLAIVNAGAGYDATATVPVDANSPSILGGTTGSADATTDAAGVVTALTVTDGGSGYTLGDIVSLPPSDPAATQPTTEATAQVNAISNPETAITINAGATGDINMGTFTVGGAPGTGLNIRNSGGVTVRVGGTQISP